MTPLPESGQLSSSVEAPAFPSRPDNSTTRRAAEGEDGEHQTFPGASTPARSAQAGETGGEGL